MNNQTYKEDDCIDYDILADMHDDEQDEFIDAAGFICQIPVFNVSVNRYKIKERL